MKKKASQKLLMCGKKKKNQIKLLHTDSLKLKKERKFTIEASKNHVIWTKIKIMNNDFSFCKSL